MNEELAVIETQGKALDRPHPRDIISQATEEANVLAEVIESQKLYSNIQGKKFVKCEGWVTLATLRGCLPREVDVTEMPEGRYVAKVELVRVSDGSVLTSASAECGGPEDPVWVNRPPNARRSMAITRATGKACRVAFSWVMALSGFEVTPLEEMPEMSAPQPTDTFRAVIDRSDVTPKEMGGFVLAFGKYKGDNIRTVDNGYLDFLIQATEKNLKDPEKQTYHDQNDLMMTRLLTEKHRRAFNAKSDAPKKSDRPSPLLPNTVDDDERVEDDDVPF